MTATVPSIGRPRTKAETAEFLNVTPRTVQRLVATGRLRCSRLGRNTPRFPDEYIAEFLDNSAAPSAPAPVKPARNPKYGSPARRAA